MVGDRLFFWPPPPNPFPDEEAPTFFFFAFFFAESTNELQCDFVATDCCKLMMGEDDKNANDDDVSRCSKMNCSGRVILGNQCLLQQIRIIMMKTCIIPHNNDGLYLLLSRRQSCT